jgi:hypothetical protein
MSTLQQAAQAVLKRWDSPQWEWSHHGPTADLMAELRAALAADKAQAEQDCDDCHATRERLADLLRRTAVAQQIGQAPPLTSWSWHDVPERAALASAPREPLTDEQALELARKHLDKGLSWAPHITRCTDMEIKALIRAIERAHGIGEQT